MILNQKLISLKLINIFMREQISDHNDDDTVMMDTLTTAMEFIGSLLLKMLVKNLFVVSSNFLDS